MKNNPVFGLWSLAFRLGFDPDVSFEKKSKDQRPKTRNPQKSGHHWPL
jgi:hypothetical protein